MPRFGANKKASLVGAFFVICTEVLAGSYAFIGAVAADVTATCGPDRIDARVHVTKVIDGDTVRLSDGQHLRLIGVDTPELSHKGAPAQPFSVDARDSLRQLLAQHQNTLNLRYDIEHHDHYGRLLAHAFLSDGNSIEAWLQAQGLGTVLVVPPNDWNNACYQTAEQQARQARRGIWALPAYQVIESMQLASAAHDFLLITGRVQHIGESGHALWLDLEGGVALRIDRNDLPNFRAFSPRDLVGKRILARGWLHREKDQQRMMNIRHPAALQVVNP